MGFYWSRTLLLELPVLCTFVTVNSIYKLTTLFSGVLFSSKTLCTGSRLFIEGVAALEWVFEESLVHNEVHLLTETVLETATVLPVCCYPPSTVLQWQSGPFVQLPMTQALPSLS